MLIHRLRRYEDIGPGAVHSSGAPAAGPQDGSILPEWAQALMDSFPTPSAPAAPEPSAEHPLEAERRELLLTRLIEREAHSRGIDGEAASLLLKGRVEFDANGQAVNTEALLDGLENERPWLRGSAHFTEADLYPPTPSSNPARMPSLSRSYLEGRTTREIADMDPERVRWILGNSRT